MEMVNSIKGSDVSEVHNQGDRIDSCRMRVLLEGSTTGAA